METSIWFLFKNQCSTNSEIKLNTTLFYYKIEFIKISTPVKFPFKLFRVIFMNFGLQNKIGLIINLKI